MSTFILLGISLPSSPICAAIPTSLSLPPNNTPRTPQTLSAPFVPSNVTHPHTPTPPPHNPNVLRIPCDGPQYGRNLSPNSCRNVFHYIDKSDAQATLSERHTGRPDDLPLPWRILSSDGLCFAQPLLLRDTVNGHASSTQMAQAAYALFQRCVVGNGVGRTTADIDTSPFPYCKFAQHAASSCGDFKGPHCQCLCIDPFARSRGVRRFLRSE